MERLKKAAKKRAQYLFTCKDKQTVLLITVSVVFGVLILYNSCIHQTSVQIGGINM